MSIKKFTKEWTLFVALAFVVAAAWAWLGLAIWFFGPRTWQELGQLGDMFGAVNSLFSGLAFAAVVYTLYLQQEEIKAQRKEAKENERVRLLQTEIFAKQLAALEKQNTTEHEKASPIFDWTSRSSGADGFSYRFKNQGGRFKMKEVIVLNHAPVQVVDFSRHYLATEMEGVVRFQGRLDGEGFTFEVRFEAFYGEDHQTFRVAPKTSPVRVIHAAA